MLTTRNCVVCYLIIYGPRLVNIYGMPNLNNASITFSSVINYTQPLSKQATGGMNKQKDNITQECRLCVANWWRLNMETLSSLLALCEMIPSVIGVFFLISLKKLLKNSQFKAAWVEAYSGAYFFEEHYLIVLIRSAQR